MVEAKWIIRLAAPPLVRKLPARMKNGIAMIGKLLSPSNSFNPTLAIGTSLRKKKKLITVRPSAIEIGMPVSISSTSSEKMMRALIGAPPAPGTSLRPPRGQRAGLGRPGARPAGSMLREFSFDDAPLRRRLVVVDVGQALDVRDLVLRQLAGAPEPDEHLDEA